MATVYGDWKIQKNGSIGTGGQAHIYHVRRENDKKDYALKRLINTKRLSRFEQEIKAIGRLNHKNIVKVVDYDIEVQKPYYVMLYYPRGNANDSKAFEWTTPEKFDFFEQLLTGLHKAHRADIVHRDLKPQNILVGEENNPIICDFGICFVEGGERVTVTDEVVASRHFSAPEVEEGRQDEVSTRSDVYSLGKILYWLMTGVILPRENHRQHKFDLAHSLNENRYEHISQILDKSIALNPIQRYEDAGDMLKEYRMMKDKFSATINYPSSVLEQKCIYCGFGHYEPAGGHVDQFGACSADTVRAKLGISVYTGMSYRVMQCTECGNIQTFELSELRKTNKNPWAHETP